MRHVIFCRSQNSLLCYTLVSAWIALTGCQLKLAKLPEEKASTVTISETETASPPPEASPTPESPGSTSATLALSLSTKTLNTGETFTFTASGGKTPYTFSVASGTGSIHSTSGLYTTPNTSGSATVRVTDAKSNTSDCAVTINPTISIAKNPSSAAISESFSFTSLTLNTHLINAREQHASVALADGKILVTGGENLTTWLGQTEIFDPTTGIWSSTGALATARSRLSAVKLNNGKVLATGGATSGSTSAKVNADLYDPATGLWTATGNLITGRYNHTETLLSDGKVLVTGGITATPAVSATAEIYDPASGIWSVTGSMASARNLHTATLLANGKVLVVGGSTDTAGNTPLATAELYDPAVGTWSNVGSLNTEARHSHIAVKLSNGKVLIAGGRNSTTPTHYSSAEVYDPSTTTWTATGSLAQVRSDHAAGLLSDGKVIVAGGCTNNYCNNNANGKKVEIYDPSAGTWSTAASMNVNRRRYRLEVLSSGNVLVFGGVGLDGILASTEVYNVAGNTWDSRNSLGTTRASSPKSVLLQDGRVLSTGGCVDNEMQLDSGRIFDPSTGVWSLTGAMPAERCNHSAVVLANGTVLTAGGDAGSSTSATASIYNPSTGSWSATGSMAQARREYGAVVLGNGKVLVAGGNVGSTPLSSSELYDPSTGTWSATGALSVARKRFHMILLLNGKVLAAGGENQTTYFSGSEIYDPSTGLWTVTGSMTNAHSNYGSLVLLPNGKVLIAGGYKTGGPSAGSELYDPSTGLWTATGSLGGNRYVQTMNLLPNGKVLAAGGKASFAGNPLMTAELYDPSAGTWSATNAMGFGVHSANSVILGDGRVLIIHGSEIGRVSVGYSIFGDYPSVTLTPSGGTGPYTYTITGGPGTLYPMGVFIPNTAASTTTIKVQDANGLYETTTVTTQ